MHGIMARLFFENLGSGQGMESLANIRRRAAAGFRRYPKLWNFLNPSYRATRDGLNELRLRAASRGEMIFDATQGNDAVRSVMESGHPAALGKIGSLEAEVADCFLKGRGYSEILRRQMLDNVGVHPTDPATLDAFCACLVDAADHLDVLAARGHPGEMDIVRRVRGRTLVRLQSYESWLYQRPWSAALEGKRVLVITPFAQSVRAQFLRRSQVWRDPSVLPEFDLRVVRMPLSPGLVTPQHKDWRERLDDILQQCESAPYDVLLVGAGGLSLPLVAHAKARGKVGFHLGGHMQILFGVMGKRWDKDRVLLGLQTDAWVRPSGDEAPSTVTKVEQGCYW
jgi:hypothetical protein